MIKLYYHVTGAENHGCEAIVRSTVDLFDEKLKLYSYDKESDMDYGLDRVIDIVQDSPRPLKKYSIPWVMAAVEHKLLRSDYRFTLEMRKDFFEEITAEDVCLSIGGDNYCYTGQEFLWHYNRGIHKKGAKTVLWGCSIEPALVTDDIKKDFALYDLIVARETISYDFLRKINPNTILACDPAFTMGKAEAELPANFVPGHTVGMNLSPLIVRRENKTGLAYESFKNLMNHILNKTDYNIALIPHVVQNGNDDRTLLNRLRDEMRGGERICIVNDCNCLQLKGIISNCVLFVGARTHATIAAYSTYVPTLVVGYSTKAIGIAKDLFGSESNYVLPVQHISDATDLTAAFDWLDNNQTEIKQHLMAVIPEYTISIETAVQAVKDLLP